MTFSILLRTIKVEFATGVDRMKRRIWSLCCVVALLLMTASGCMWMAALPREYQKVEAVFVPKNGEVMDEAAILNQMAEDATKK